MLLSVAGPLALAKKSLEVDPEPFFVLNSDVICNYPFEQMLKFHKAHGKEGTIVVSLYTGTVHAGYHLGGGVIIIAGSCRKMS